MAPAPPSALLVRLAAGIGAVALVVGGFGLAKHAPAVTADANRGATPIDPESSAGLLQVRPRESSTGLAVAEPWQGADRRGASSSASRSQLHAESAKGVALLSDEEVKALLACAHEAGGDCPHLEPDPLTLEEMARCGIVRLDVPSFMGSLGRVPEMDSDWATQVGLTDSESLAMMEVAGRFRQAYYDGLREHARLAGIASEFPDSTPLIALLGAIEDGYGLDTARQSYASIAKERAGMLDSDSDLEWSDADRYARNLASLGDDFESELAATLGAARARELHVAADGWGRKIQTGNTCDDHEQ